MAMRDALERAGLKPSDIDVVIAHGEGTVIGDRNEIEAIHAVFSECIDRVHVFSSKGSLGHLLAGAPLVDIDSGHFHAEKRASFRERSARRLRTPPSGSLWSTGSPLERRPRRDSCQLSEL